MCSNKNKAKKQLLLGVICIADAVKMSAVLDKFSRTNKIIDCQLLLLGNNTRADWIEFVIKWARCCSCSFVASSVAL